MKKLLLLLFSAFILYSNSVFADTLKDLQISNKVAFEFGSGNLILAERLLNELEDPDLNMIWTSNIIGKYYSLDDRESVIRLLPKLNDPDIIQIWTSNVIVKAMTM